VSRRKSESLSEDWINDARRRLAERRGKKPETKAGQIWALWPEIKAAIGDGQSMKSIRLWLEEEAGVVVTTGSLRSYIRRCRAKELGRRKTDEPSCPDTPDRSQKPNPSSPAGTAALPPATVMPRTAPKTADQPPTADDPMAAARKALNKPRLIYARSTAMVIPPIAT